MDIVRAAENGLRMPDLDFERDVMMGMMLQFVLIFFVLSLSLFITLRFITRHLWRPFDETLHQAELFNIEQQALPHLPATNISEFVRLNRTLETLMRKDINSFRIQKEFTENASHELQTPLALIRSRLDLLMQEELSAKQMQMVTDLYQITSRMGKLNRNLLLLAKIDNAQYCIDESVDLDAMIRETLPFYAALSDNKIVRVDDHCTHKQEPLRANSVLLDSMLKNIIVNAMRHAPDHSEIVIRREDGRLSVVNAAADSQPLNTATLFERFHAGNKGGGGNGLGPSIVKAICDFHGWLISYRFEAGHHCFIVDFASKSR